MKIKLSSQSKIGGSRGLSIKLAFHLQLFFVSVEFDRIPLPMFLHTFSPRSASDKVGMRLHTMQLQLQLCSLTLLSAAIQS